jgi:hypothetical protein
MVRLLTDLVEEVDPLMELAVVEEMAVVVPVLTDQLLLQYQEQQILVEEVEALTLLVAVQELVEAEVQAL